MGKGGWVVGRGGEGGVMVRVPKKVRVISLCIRKYVNLWVRVRGGYGRVKV